MSVSGKRCLRLTVITAIWTRRCARQADWTIALPQAGSGRLGEGVRNDAQSIISAEPARLCGRNPSHA